MDPRNRYDSLFQFYAEEHPVPWKLLKAQALAESRLDPDAVSRVGALGISQFMPSTFADFLKAEYPDQQQHPMRLLDPRDPEDGIHAQAWYMAQMLKSNGGDVQLALASYNWGVGHVKRLQAQLQRVAYDQICQNMPQETQQYVRRVTSILSSL